MDIDGVHESLKSWRGAMFGESLTLWNMHSECSCSNLQNQESAIIWEVRPINA